MDIFNQILDNIDPWFSRLERFIKLSKFCWLFFDKIWIYGFPDLKRCISLSKFSLSQCHNRVFQRNWVFVTNSDFLIPISLIFNARDLRYFKLWNILDQIIIFRNNKCQHHQVAKIKRFENQNLWLKFSSFGKIC